MGILITPFNWGEARKEDLLKVLDSVIETLDIYFESSISENVLVEHNPDIGPRVLFDKGPNNEFQVKLSSKNMVWDQHSYQFSHEYCHIRTNYNNGKLKTQWFEETICELASLFTLRRMSEIWKVNAPYANWQSYSSSLFSYAENRITDDKYHLPLNQDFHAWFGEKLPYMEKDPYLREFNTLIAIKLLKTFEDNPKLWVGMTYFSTWETLESDDIFTSFDKWLNCIPEELKVPVKKLIEVFEFKA